MKNTLFITFMVALTFSSLGNQTTVEQIRKAKLKEAIVYTSGVQLRSSLSYNAVKGINEIIIEGISPSIDPQTIQVSATGNVVILDSKYSLFYPKAIVKDVSSESSRIKRSIRLLNDSIESMGFDIRDLKEQTSVYQQAQNMLRNNGVMKNQGKVSDSLELLQEAIELYTSKMSALNKKLISISKATKFSEKKLAKMNKRLNHLRNRLSNLGQTKSNTTPIPRVTVSLISEGNVSGKINFSYLSANAGWSPLYDIRSESTEGKIFMNYKAQVYQNTELEWKNIKLRISTNNPYANKTKPELNPWYINYVNYRSQLSVSRNDNYNMKSSPQEAITNRGYALESIQEDEIALDADQFTKVVQQLIAAEFKINLPYSIASNGQKHMVLVQKSELETNFKYYAVPKMDQSVYLVAEMLKVDELQLIPSKANIFFDGSYIGETYIDPTKMNDTLYLSLGKDPNISITRKLLSSRCKEKTIGDKIEKLQAYSIEIKNMKSSQIEVVIQDQIPITTNSDIVIDKINVGKGKLKERTGLIEWKVKLNPKDKKTFDFDYRIKFDKSKQINI
ncbi:MAG: DUF4139 domain-containing protein [Crocinitomicaceae bacterium]|nr:DUF4139 domain-containing protein [Crocinitomicaceae bacterium]